MYKIIAKKTWYQAAALSEGDYEISAGPEIFPFSIGGKSSSGMQGTPTSSEIDQQMASIQIGFRIFMRRLRINSALTISELAKKTDIEVDQLFLIEQKDGYKPYPRTLIQLSKFYEIPLSALMQMVGSTRKIDKELEENVVRYAAESDSFEKLSSKEKKALNELVKILRDYSKKH